jgi:hypothetical protein
MAATPLMMPLVWGVESMKLRPEVNSLARWREEIPSYGNPQFMALAEKTLYAGLRRVGFPDE